MSKKSEREEYKRRLEMKKRQKKRRQQSAHIDGNPAKAVSPSTLRKDLQSKKSVSSIVGKVLLAIQVITSLVFLFAVWQTGMLPAKYIAIVGVVLLIFCAITAATQLRNKNKAIPGKIFAVLMIVIFAIGSFYLLRINQAVSDISGANQKTDVIAVAVKAEDPAESLEDAKDYDFGVQYALKGDQIKAAMEDINKEAGQEVKTEEYQSLAEQAQALADGDVEAIVYNEGYTGILEESFEGYSDKVKIIYEHKIVTEVATEPEKEVDESFAVYISGIDVYGDITTNSRSDVNIIAEVNPTSHQILLITTPRDYYVEIPGVSGGQKDKLTHAGIYGVDVSMATLEQLYNTELDFYARVNFTSLVNIVDALGGVDVESELAFTTSADSGLVMDVVQGTNHFNGKQALAFSRERQNVPGGDNQRGKDQQAVITAMIKKMVSPAIIVGANGIINSVSSNVDTNMSSDQLQQLIRTQISDAPKWNIYSVAAEGTGDSQPCYSYGSTPLYVTQPDAASIQNIESLIDQVENGDVLEGSATTE